MKTTSRILISFVFFSSSLCFIYGKPEAHYSDNGVRMSISQFKMCSDKPSSWPIHTTVKTLEDGTTTIDWNITMTEDFDDSLIINADVKRWGEDGWEHNFLSVKRNHACTTLLHGMPYMSKPFFKALGAIHCPIPKGVYSTTDMIPNMPRGIRALGKFWADIKIVTPSGEVKWCLDVIANLSDGSEE